MTNKLEYIDDYFKGLLTPEQTREFDREIIDDPDFASLVSFYISFQQAASSVSTDERRLRFKHLESAPHAKFKTGIIHQLRPYMAVAAVVSALIIGGFLFFRPTSPQQLADQYIKNQLTSLGVTMSSNRDSMQSALHLYNEGKMEDALLLFQKLIQSDSSNTSAITNAGIASLRLKDYDRALAYFTQLEKHTEMYANPGKFYHALTLLERNRPEDLQVAKDLLNQVVENGLAKREIAVEFLKKL
jgi:tetratricopeptide (TPR) repeat protein